MAAYHQCPETAAAYAELDRPAWLADVAVQLWARPELDGDAVKETRRALAFFERGDVMVILNQPFIWGDFGENETFLNIWGAHTADGEYVRLLRELKALSPRVKVALYTWLWTVPPEAPFYREWPEAFIDRDRAGRVFNSYPALELTFQRKMSDAAAVRALAGQYRRMMEKYLPDFVYLDGGKGGSSVIDWRDGSVDQDYHWQDFYLYMRGLAAEYGAGGVCFNSKANPVADVGIAEMAMDAFRTAPRTALARIWGGKLQEKHDPGHRVAPCY